MNIFWTHFIVGTLLLFQGVLAQIRILITAEDNSHGKEKKEKRHITLRCRVTDTTDIHIKCQDLWWTREIDQVNHKEVVIGHMKKKSFLTGYQTKLSVHPPKEQSQEVYSCHALCGLQTFTATCHLKDLKNSMIECSSHFMNSYQKLKLRNESTEIHEMKTTLSIGTPLFGIMLVILLIIAGQKIMKKCRNKEVPPAEVVEIIEKHDSSDDLKAGNSNKINPPQKTEGKPVEVKYNCPSIMVNGELVMDGDTPFAKVSYKSNNKPVISYVQDMKALQNWDPGVSCFTLAEGDDNTNEDNFDKEKLLVPDNDCYTWNRSASCPEVTFCKP